MGHSDPQSGAEPGTPRHSVLSGLLNDYCRPVRPGVLKRTVSCQPVFRKASVVTGVYLQTLEAQLPYQYVFAISSKRTDLYMGQLSKFFHAERKAL